MKVLNLYNPLLLFFPLLLYACQYFVREVDATSNSRTVRDNITGISFSLIHNTAKFSASNTNLINRDFKMAQKADASSLPLEN